MREKKKSAAHTDSDHNHKTEADAKVNGKDNSKSLGKNRNKSCEDQTTTRLTVSPAQVIIYLLINKLNLKKHN